MDGLEATYVLKAGSVGKPKTYLGAQVSEYMLENADNPVKTRWSLSAEDYIHGAVKDFKMELEKVGKVLAYKVTTPTTADYQPELDQTKALEPECATYYTGIIGILRWCIKIRRIHIIVEVSLLSHFLACPHERHLQQEFHVFGYLRQHTRSWMVFDETEPEVDQSEPEVDQSHFWASRLDGVSNSSGHSGTEGMLCGNILLCQLRPCWVPTDSAVPHWHSHLCEQRADFVALQEIEYSGVFDVWF
jgi:hypothetical protein